MSRRGEKEAEETLVQKHKDLAQDSVFGELTANRSAWLSGRGQYGCVGKEIAKVGGRQTMKGRQRCGEPLKNFCEGSGLTRFAL